MTEEKETTQQTDTEKAERNQNSEKQAGSMALDKKELTLRYLAALMQYAVWIPEGYKKLVVKGISIEMLRELYLCACDGIPLKKVQEAQREENGVKTLIKLRREHLRKSLLKEQEQKLADLQKRMVVAETKIIEQEHMISNVPKSGTFEKEDKIGKAESENNPEEIKSVHIQRKRHWMMRGESTVSFLTEIMKDYDAKQLRFILDCIEEGVPVKRIRAFISPVLPVEVMQRLKEIEQKKGEKSIWNRIEKLIRS